MHPQGQCNCVTYERKTKICFTLLKLPMVHVNFSPWVRNPGQCKRGINSMWVRGRALSRCVHECSEGGWRELKSYLYISVRSQKRGKWQLLVSPDSQDTVTDRFWNFKRSSFASHNLLRWERQTQLHILMLATCYCLNSSSKSPPLQK